VAALGESKELDVYEWTLARSPQIAADLREILGGLKRRTVEVLLLP
jgi:hypothetical protein